MVPRSALPSRALDAVIDLFNRNPWSSRALQGVDRVTLKAYAGYTEDDLRTEHAHPFVTAPRFVRAYSRAVRAGTFDYGIRWRAHTILWAAETAARLDGVFVECGTARGFMASAVCDYLAWTDRPFYLFDAFESTDNPAEAPYYADGPEGTRKNFAEWPGVRLVVGRIPATLAAVDIDRVAFLHIDMNRPAPEAAAVRFFWPLLVPGGLMVFDDYGFDGYAESRASVECLAMELGFTVLACPTGQGIVVKS